MAGEQIAARRRPPHSPRRAGRSATGAHARAGSATELSRQRPSPGAREGLRAPARRGRRALPARLAAARRRQPVTPPDRPQPSMTTGTATPQATPPALAGAGDETGLLARTRLVAVRPGRRAAHRRIPARPLSRAELAQQRARLQPHRRPALWPCCCSAPGAVSRSGGCPGSCSRSDRGCSWWATSSPTTTGACSAARCPRPRSPTPSTWPSIRCWSSACCCCWASVTTPATGPG